MRDINNKIIVTSCVILLAGCAGSPVRRAITPLSGAPEGYELVAKDSKGFKWYVAPASRTVIQIEGRNTVTGKVEVNPFTSISLAIPYSRGTIYEVEAYACNLLPGTFAAQRSDKRGWDERYTTVAYGTIRWQIWNYVCKK